MRESIWLKHRAWSLKTFGPNKDRGPVGPLKHLLLEIEELRQNPKDPEEIADCGHLIMDAAQRAGMKHFEFVAATIASCTIHAIVDNRGELPLEEMLNSLRNETEVLIENPDQKRRYGDLMSLLVGITLNLGYTSEEFEAALVFKQCKNERRKYEPTSADEPVLHKKAEV